MSSQELVTAYSQGRISRRTMIRRLVAGGVSVGAAVSYAHLLAPDRAAGNHHSGDCQDNYPDLHVKLKGSDLRKVIQEEKIRMRSSVDCSSVKLDCFASLVDKEDVHISDLGFKRYKHKGSGAKIVKIPLSKEGREALKGRDRARIRVVVFNPGTPIANDVKVYKR